MFFSVDVETMSMLLAFERNCLFCGHFFRLDFCCCFLVRTAKRTSYNM